ncbi:ATP-binding protein [uncultured Jatrophihabitans sp.]|uniref:ATP-binding protein n=1 Tax=uncultured Jatrophihabitans sp. TaxID=1610747 RepID=UPI0035CA17D7
MLLTRTSRYQAGDASAVTQARHWCRNELSSALPQSAEVGYDVELVLSELVTNAIRARCRDLQVTLVVSERSVRVEVFDDAPGTPALVAFQPDSDHGRGLAIVAAVSQEWGVRPAVDGKHVWAVLSVHVGAPTNTSH